VHGSNFQLRFGSFPPLANLPLRLRPARTQETGKSRTLHNAGSSFPSKESSTCKCDQRTKTSFQEFQASSCCCPSRLSAPLKYKNHIKMRPVVVVVLVLFIAWLPVACVQAVCTDSASYTNQLIACQQETKPPTMSTSAPTVQLTFAQACSLVVSLGVNVPLSCANQVSGFVRCPFFQIDFPRHIIIIIFIASSIELT